MVNPTCTLVATTDLVEGDIVHDHGMVLRLERRREYPDPDKRTTGPIVAFVGVVLNVANIEADAKAGNGIAAFISSRLREDARERHTTIPVWTVQGNQLARWLREDR